MDTTSIKANVWRYVQMELMLIKLQEPVEPVLFLAALVSTILFAIPVSHRTFSSVIDAFRNAQSHIFQTLPLFANLVLLIAKYVLPWHTASNASRAFTFWMQRVLLHVRWPIIQDWLQSPITIPVFPVLSIAWIVLLLNIVWSATQAIFNSTVYVWLLVQFFIMLLTLPTIVTVLNALNTVPAALITHTVSIA